jgi:protein-S-isoprenylcysteine O-methyltransferase Ste14
MRGSYPADGGAGEVTGADSSWAPGAQQERAFHTGDPPFGTAILLSVAEIKGGHDNTFASQLVRIQTERGQHVINAGVYGFVRHPMYLGASLVFIGGALLLGSISGLLAGLAIVGLMVVRIFGEEKLLARDLEGYKEYLQKVRYRLVPHVW